jgi:hypothetical protein
MGTFAETAIADSMFPFAANKQKFAVSIFRLEHTQKTEVAVFHYFRFPFTLHNKNSILKR